MDENYFRKITATVVIAVLLVLSFFLLKPILLSIILGFIIAIVLSPVHNKLYKWTNMKNLSALILCVLLIALIILPLWFFTPTLIDESIKLYKASQGLDLVTPLKAIFPSFFASDEFSQEAGAILHSFITKVTSSLMSYLSNLILDLPLIILHIFVIFFTFFYALRDKEKIIGYIKSILPFSKEVEKKLFDHTRDITFSVIYGNIIVGAIQGIILGIGFFVFQVPNAFVLSLLAILFGVLPILGPVILGVPVIIFLILGGNYLAAWGIAIFTFISSFSDNILRPILVSRKTQLHNGLVLIGMIGGFLLFGILGFILGPLILAYLIIIIEIYRNKSTSILIQQEKK